jgi:molecular chaperone DnaK
MHVSAKDMGTGNEQKIQIQGGSGLSDDEVQQMVKDAESHADEDRRMKDLAEARNEAEGYAFSVEKSLKENEERLDDATRSDIRSKIDAVTQSLESDDATEIRSKLEALQEASYELGKLVYEQARSQAGDGAANGSADTTAEGDEEIVDAEVVDEAGDRA